MKRHTFLVLTLFFALFITGCNGKGKDTELVTTGDSVGSGSSGVTGSSSAGGNTAGTEGSANLPGATGTPGTSQAGSGTVGSGMAPTENKSIDSSGAMVTHSEGKPAPDGEVWCENCKGHLPVADAVESGGKSYCMACAEELKIKN